MGNTFAMQRSGRLQRRYSGETERSWSVLSSTKLTRTFNSASDDQVAPYSQRVVAFYFDALLFSVVIANDKVLCLVAMLSYKNKTNSIDKVSFDHFSHRFVCPLFRYTQFLPPCEHRKSIMNEIESIHKVAVLYKRPIKQVLKASLWCCARAPQHHIEMADVPDRGFWPDGRKKNPWIWADDVVEAELVETLGRLTLQSSTPVKSKTVTRFFKYQDRAVQCELEGPPTLREARAARGVREQEPPAEMEEQPQDQEPTPEQHHQKRRRPSRPKSKRSKKRHHSSIDQDEAEFSVLSFRGDEQVSTDFADEIEDYDGSQIVDLRVKLHKKHTSKERAKEGGVVADSPSPSSAPKKRRRKLTRPPPSTTSPAPAPVASSAPTPAVASAAATPPASQPSAGSSSAKKKEKGDPKRKTRAKKTGETDPKSVVERTEASAASVPAAKKTSSASSSKPAVAARSSPPPLRINVPDFVALAKQFPETCALPRPDLVPGFVPPRQPTPNAPVFGGPAPVPQRAAPGWNVQRQSSGPAGWPQPVNRQTAPAPPPVPQRVPDCFAYLRSIMGNPIAPSAPTPFSIVDSPVPHISNITAAAPLVPMHPLDQFRQVRERAGMAAPVPPPAASPGAASLSAAALDAWPGQPEPSVAGQQEAMRLKMKELEAAREWFRRQDRLNVERMASAHQSVAVLDRDIALLQMMQSGNLMGDSSAGTSSASSSFVATPPVDLTQQLPAAAPPPPPGVDDMDQEDPPSFAGPLIG